MARKESELKARWIAEHKADPRLDYDIIFKYDEEIHDGIKMQFSFTAQNQVQAAADVKNKRATQNYSEHAKMTDADWEHAFYQLLDAHLINVPPNYYEDQLYFTDTDVLKQMFAKMEEQNLNMIHHQQEQEQAYEGLLQREQKSRAEKQLDYEERHKALLDLIRKIETSKTVLSTLKKKTTDGFIFEPVAGETDAKGQPKLQPVDFNNLLAKLRTRIM